MLSALQGYNAAIIAYGQTGTGKTFTMEGERSGPGACQEHPLRNIQADMGCCPSTADWWMCELLAAGAEHRPYVAAPGRGIIRRAIEDVFAAIEHDAAPHSKFLVRASYLQIYNEVRTVASMLLSRERRLLFHVVKLSMMATELQVYANTLPMTR
jgi:Kinesin motor domain